METKQQTRENVPANIEQRLIALERIVLRAGERNQSLYSKERIDFIIDTVCNWFGISREKLESKERFREIVVPRQIAMALLLRHTNLSCVEIGKMFGQRDHTTVIHSKKTVSNLCFTDERYKETFDLLERKIQ